jgi:hypothetical protein
MQKRSIDKDVMKGRKKAGKSTTGSVKTKLCALNLY